VGLGDGWAVGSRVGFGVGLQFPHVARQFAKASGRMQRIGLLALTHSHVKFGLPEMLHELESQHSMKSPSQEAVGLGVGDVVGDRVGRCVGWKVGEYVGKSVGG